MKEAIRDSRTEEWVILHRDFEKYEQSALVIKLMGVVVCLLCLRSSIHPVLSILLILTLWFIEAIWKTFQMRMGERILRIEKMLADKNGQEEPPFQFYSEWEMNRAGLFGLINEYISNSLRPTVVYHYAILTLILILSTLLSL